MVKPVSNQKKQSKDGDRVDKVEQFISENKHQLGYIMGEASRQWIKENPAGALTVGPCNVFIEKYGDYHTLQDKVERYEKVLAFYANKQSYSRSEEEYFEGYPPEIMNDRGYQARKALEE